MPIIVDARVWGLAVGLRRRASHTEVHIGRFAELIATALVAGYRDQRNGSSLRRATFDLIDSLRDGLSTIGLWVAGHLRLPINGPFVVIAAPSAGETAVGSNRSFAASTYLQLAAAA